MGDRAGQLAVGRALEQLEELALRPRRGRDHERPRQLAEGDLRRAQRREERVGAAAVVV
jgi:hypothetical protein